MEGTCRGAGTLRLRAAVSDDIVRTRDAVIASCIGSREDDLCLLILARTGD